MAKFASTSVLDALLDKVGTATQLLVTTSQPADRTAAIAASLATKTLSGAFANLQVHHQDARQLLLNKQTFQ